ncbi:MAG: response regulator [Sediminibacterium sp.]
MKKIMLLLAEDDNDDSEFFKEALISCDPAAELVVVTNGKKATEYLTACALENLPHAILLDYNMPFMNAPQVLDWLCSRNWLNGIHKFVWSTSSQQHYVDGCRGKGALDYFIKPTNEEGIKTIVERILAHCRESGTDLLTNK